jgi:hypothetical protein
MEEPKPYAAAFRTSYPPASKRRLQATHSNKDDTVSENEGLRKCDHPEYAKERKRKWRDSRDETLKAQERLSNKIMKFLKSHESEQLTKDVIEEYIVSLIGHGRSPL